MAGGLVKYRHLSRNSGARQALLRSQVTALVMHEHIQTTYAKAKESQRLAEKMITIAKKNTDTSRKKVGAILYEPERLLNHVFTELRDRYANREGGYTRVTRTDNVNQYDQAEYAVLELVDGPRDSRYHMTALATARDRVLGKPPTDITRHNIAKVTRFRKDGEAEFEATVEKMMARWGDALREEARHVPRHVVAKSVDGEDFKAFEDRFRGSRESV